MKKIKLFIKIVGTLFILFIFSFNLYQDKKYDDKYDEYKVLESVEVETEIIDKFVKHTTHTRYNKGKEINTKVKNYYHKVSYQGQERLFEITSRLYRLKIGDTINYHLLTVEHEGGICQILSHVPYLEIDDLKLVNEMLAD